MKKFMLCLAAAAVVMMTGCKKDDKDEPTTNVSWTKEQRETIQSLRPVDNEGYVYEINYTADYHLDELLQRNADNMVSAINDIKETILPNSDWHFPFEILKVSMGLGCTCFSAPADGGYILGRNYDFPPADDHSMIVHTPQVKDANGNITRHATVGCADLAPVTLLLDAAPGYQTDMMKEFSLYSPYFILDGINDAGLMCGLMILEYDGTFQPKEAGKLNLLNVMIPRLILDKCTTVNEAVNLIQQYSVQTMFNTNEDKTYCIDMHFVIADNSGDRVVVEWVDNDIRIMRPFVDGELLGQTDDDYVLATNFYLASDSEPCPWDVNELGFWRYDTLDMQLANLDAPLTMDKAMNLCYSVRITNNDEDAINAMTILDPYHLTWDDKNAWPWITVWSEVYDTQTLSMRYCSREEYGKPYTFNLEYQK